MAIDMVVWSWILLISGFITIAICAYRFIWLERYRFPSGLGDDAVRLKGRVAGQAHKVVYCLNENGCELVARPFVLASKDKRNHLIIPNGSVLDVKSVWHQTKGRVRGVVVGDWITVDGAPTTMSNDENLYRESGRVPALEAVRIVGGSWPEIRWLRFPLAVAVLAFMLSVGQILFSPSPPRPFQAFHSTTARFSVEMSPYSTFYFGSQLDEQGVGALIGSRLDNIFRVRETTGCPFLDDSYASTGVDLDKLLDPHLNSPHNPSWISITYQR